MEKILLIDDEPDALEVLTWMLTDRGYEVRAETQAEVALEVGREFKPDLLITDYYLRQGEMSGVDVIRRLRAQSPALRVVLMTGMPVDELRAELASVAPIEVLSKPFVWTDVVARLGLDAPVRSCA